jgi:hypothetical protein
VMEDVAIAYGYNNLVTRIPKTVTAGRELPLNQVGRREGGVGGMLVCVCVGWEFVCREGWARARNCLLHAACCCALQGLQLAINTPLLRLLRLPCRCASCCAGSARWLGSQRSSPGRSAPTPKTLSSCGG